MHLRKMTAFAAGAIFTILTLGGCPSDATLSQDTTDLAAADVSAGTDGNSLGDTANPVRAAGATATAAGADSAFSTQLATRFPACEQPADAESMAEEVMRLVNQERAANGLGAVARSATLEREAAQYACEMVQYDFFDHVNPVTGSTLGDRTKDFGYSFRVVGENLAAGQKTAQQAFTDWMNSPGHRKNILDPRFTELGVSVKLGGQYGIYWVQEFGQPAP